MRTLVTSVAVIAIAAVAHATPYQVGNVDLNIRTGANSRHPVVAVMPAGIVVDATNCMAAEPYWDPAYGAMVQGPPWCNVNWNGITGWASTSGMGPAPATPPVIVAAPPIVPVPAPSYAGQPNIIINNNLSSNPPVINNNDTHGNISSPQNR